MTNILSEINSAVCTDAAAFVALEETAYKNQIKCLAEKIALLPGRQIVMIAGPSASGKTTSAHFLCSALEQRGVFTRVVSLDDFYLNPEDQPLLSDGSRDIESVDSLDVELIETTLRQLLSSGAAVMPRFDFSVQHRAEKSETLTLPQHGALIVEGLHGLNPLISSHLSKENLTKVYISVNRPLLWDDGSTLLTSRQIRLARRLIRDWKFRGSSAARTLSYWTNVVQEEEKCLLRYKPEADVKIVTLHGYEPCLYAPYLAKFQNELDPETANYDSIVQTTRALSRFYVLDPSFVPRDSLIREFIGDDACKSIPVMVK